MIFISLIKFRKKAKDVADFGNKVLQNLPAGVKMVSSYWTVGRYDSVWIFEAPSEKEAVKVPASAPSRPCRPGAGEPQSALSPQRR